MAPYSAPTPTRTLDSRHTADRCAVCTAFCAGATAMVVDARTCDGLRERDLVERCDLTLGIFSRHMGDMQRCLVTTYAQMAAIVFDRVELALNTGNDWDESLGEGFVSAVLELDRIDGGTFFFFVAADRSRDPVMWLERSAVQQDLVHLLVSAPFPDAFDAIRAEMFCGALRGTMRRRALTEDGFADPRDVADDVASLTDVFGV